MVCGKIPLESVVEMIYMIVASLGLAILLGSFLLVVSYYYLGEWINEYLGYIAQRAEHSRGTRRDFYDLFFILQSSGHRLLPPIISFISYIIIGFGILATFEKLNHTVDAYIFGMILIAFFMGINVICMFLEIRIRAKLSARILRLTILNLALSFFMSMGYRLVASRTFDIIVPAAAFFFGANLGIVAPGLRYILTRKRENEPCE